MGIGQAPDQMEMRVDTREDHMDQEDARGNGLEEEQGRKSEKGKEGAGTDQEEAMDNGNGQGRVTPPKRTRKFFHL